MEGKMVYAPVMIVTCNRYKHLERCIESLKKNSYALKTEVYISVDYPPNDQYVDGWKKNCEYLEHPIEGFKEVFLFFQQKNLGVDENIFFLRNKIFEKYDRVIFTEDDNEFSENFLEYMDKGLDLFKDDPQVFGICGYAHDCNFRNHGENIIALTDFNMWGAGLWKEKEKIILEQLWLKNWIAAAQKRRLMLRIFRKRKRLFSRMLGEVLAEEHGDSVRLTDINRGIFLALNGFYTINPIISKVRNWGWDGSGLNIQGTNIKNMEYIGQAIDIELHFEYSSKNVKPDIYNDRLLDDNHEWNWKRAKWYNDPATYILYRLLGRKRFFEIIRKKGE